MWEQFIPWLDCWNVLETAAKSPVLLKPLPSTLSISHANQLLIIYIAWRPFVKSLEYQLQLQLAVFPLYQRQDQPLGASRHMLLPCERSGNKCEATNGGPSTSPSSPPPPPPDVRESIAAGECNSE